MDYNAINKETFKKLLIDLEDEQAHLKASIGHLKQEVEKREIEVQNLLVQRELQFAREASTTNTTTTFKPKQPSSYIDKQQQTQETRSPFSKQITELLNNIIKTSEEINQLLV